ncbi:hypothetical protein DFH27DRAFT_618556 [Peziza echinospora]|nr:hypothetical protein DFH27DRAFT_618556 [Peziza echinospora]
MSGTGDSGGAGGLRRACDNCRLRKYKCSGERGGCARCVSDGDVCRYGAKEQMGRPRKGTSTPATVAAVRGKGVEKPTRRKAGAGGVDKTAAAQRRWEEETEKDSSRVNTIHNVTKSVPEDGNMELDYQPLDLCTMAIDSMQPQNHQISSDMTFTSPFYTYVASGNINTDVHMNEGNNAYTIQTEYDIPLPGQLHSTRIVAGQPQKMRARLSWKLNLPNLDRISSMFGANPFDMYPQAPLSGQDYTGRGGSRVLSNGELVQDHEELDQFKSLFGEANFPNLSTPQPPNQYANPYGYNDSGNPDQHQDIPDGPLPYLPQAPNFGSEPTPLCACAFSFYQTYTALQVAVVTTPQQQPPDLPAVFSQTLSLGVLAISTCRTLLGCTVCYGKMPNILLMGTIIPTTMMVYERTYVLITEAKGFPGAPDWKRGVPSAGTFTAPEESGKMWRRIAVDALRRDMVQINSMAGDMIQTSIKSVMEVERPRGWDEEMWAKQTIEKRKAKKARAEAAAAAAAAAGQTGSSGGIQAEGVSAKLVQKAGHVAKKMTMKDAAISTQAVLGLMTSRPKDADLPIGRSQAQRNDGSGQLGSDSAPRGKDANDAPASTTGGNDNDGEGDVEESEKTFGPSGSYPHTGIVAMGNPDGWIHGGTIETLDPEELPACYRTLVGMQDHIFLRTAGLELAFDSHNEFENGEGNLDRSVSGGIIVCGENSADNRAAQIQQQHLQSQQQLLQQLQQQHHENSGGGSGTGSSIANSSTGDLDRLWLQDALQIAFSERTAATTRTHTRAREKLSGDVGRSG